MTIEIRRGKLFVRPLTEADVPLLYKWMNDPRVLEFYEGRDRPHSMQMIREHFLKNVSGVGANEGAETSGSAPSVGTNGPFCSLTCTWM